MTFKTAESLCVLLGYKFRDGAVLGKNKEHCFNTHLSHKGQTCWGEGIAVNARGEAYWNCRACLAEFKRHSWKILE